MNKTYTIELDGQIIGKTALEKADAPMGVVFGLISFIDIKSGYEYFKKYCAASGIPSTDYSDLRFLQSFAIPQLRVYSGVGTEIKGIGTHISGMDSEGFEINIVGISYPFYQAEFPHHVKEYEGMFGDK